MLEITYFINLENLNFLLFHIIENEKILSFLMKLTLLTKDVLQCLDYWRDAVFGPDIEQTNV